MERENEMIVISHRLFLFSRDRSCPKEGLKPIRCIVIVIGGDVILRLVEIGETDAHQGELGVSLAQRPLNPQPSSKPNGLGLGTFLAHATLEKLGGRLEVRPQAGQILTRLSLPLPRHADPAAD